METLINLAVGVVVIAALYFIADKVGMVDKIKAQFVAPKKKK